MNHVPFKFVCTFQKLHGFSMISMHHCCIVVVNAVLVASLLLLLSLGCGCIVVVVAVVVVVVVVVVSHHHVVVASSGSSRASRSCTCGKILRYRICSNLTGLAWGYDDSPFETGYAQKVRRLTNLLSSTLSLPGPSILYLHQACQPLTRSPHSS